MDKPITTRLPEEFVSNLKEIAKKENIDVSTAIRKLLAEAMKEWKIEYALMQYKKGEFSFGQAANFSGINIWDFPELLKQNKIPINYDEEELEEDLKTIGWKKK
jgi:predicted HTH domain antitoxin